MRIRICIVLLLAVLVVCFLGGCNGEEAQQLSSDTSNGTIGVLLFSDNVNPDNELDGVTTLMKGVWDWKNGTFQWEETPQVTLSGASRLDNFLSWDGGERYYLLNTVGASAQTDTVEIISYLEDCEGGERLFWGPGYQVKVTEQGQCTIYQDGAESVLVENLAGPVLSGRTVPLEEFILFGGTLEEGKLVLVYGRLADRTESSDSILAVTLDLQTKETIWSSLVDISHEYRAGVFLDSSPNKPMLGSKMYVSTGESVAFFDVETAEFVELSALPGEIEKLIPGIQRATLLGKPFAADLMGSTEEVVIACFCYQEQESQIPHVVYVAVQGNQVMGFLDQRQEKNQCVITIYDSAAKKRDQVQVSNVTLAPRFQMRVSPLPF